MSGPCGHIGLPYSPRHKGVKRKLQCRCQYSEGWLRSVAPGGIIWTGQIHAITVGPLREPTCARQHEPNATDNELNRQEIL